MGQVFAELVWIALIAAVTYWCVAGRPADPLNRALQKMGCICMGAIALYAVPLFSASGVSADDVVSSCVIGIAVAVGLLRRRTRQEDPPPKSGFQVDHYLIAVAVLVAWHLALAQLAAGLADGDFVRAVEATPDWSDDAFAQALTFIFFFCASQASTGALHKGFAASLQRDWRIAEGSPHRRRPLLLGLAAFPVVACLPPSLMTGALLSGLFVRLAVLVIAYRMTRGLPRGRDAEFLSWSLLATAKVLLGRIRSSRPVL